jgi:hypothetical protein
MICLDMILAANGFPPEGSVAQTRTKIEKKQIDT